MYNEVVHSWRMVRTQGRPVRVTLPRAGRLPPIIHKFST